MKTIWKINLEFDDLNGKPKSIKLPNHSIPISANIQHGKIAIWVRVDDSLEMNNYKIASIGAGISFEDVGLPLALDPYHVGSILTHGGTIVHHVCMWWDSE